MCGSSYQPMMMSGPVPRLAASAALGRTSSQVMYSTETGTPVASVNFFVLAFHCSSSALMKPDQRSSRSEASFSGLNTGPSALACPRARPEARATPHPSSVRRGILRMRPPQSSVCAASSRFATPCYKSRPMRSFPISLALCAALGCKTPSAVEKPTDATAAKTVQVDQAGLVSALVQKHGEEARPRAERGVRQVTAYWRAQDGDAATLKAFVEEAFVSDPQQLDALLKRFSAAFEQIDGHLLEVGRALRSWSELELGPQMEVDQLFAALDVGAHLSEDLFSTRLAFVALLNFGQPDLEEMVAAWPRGAPPQWSAGRAAVRVAHRPSCSAVHA